MIHGVAGLWAQSFHLCIHHSLSPSPTHTLCPVHGRIPSPSHAQSFSLCIHQSVTHSNTLSCRRTHLFTKSHTMLQSLHPSVSQSVNHLHTLSCPWAHPFVNHTQPFDLHPPLTHTLSCPVGGHIPSPSHTQSFHLHPPGSHSLTPCPVLAVDTSLHQVTHNPSICIHQGVIHSRTLSCPWTQPFTKAHRMTPSRREDGLEHVELNTCKLCGFTDTGLGAGLPDAKFRKTSSQAVTSIFVPHVTISFSIIGPEHTPSLILNNSLDEHMINVHYYYYH